MPDFKMRHYQLGALDAFAEAIKIGQRNLLETLPTGTGKCFALGTPILMYDGTIKAVENVVPGDSLMGPDSKSRKVLSLGRGREMMYRITPSKGDSYVVNESHILSLKMVKGASHCTGARGGEYAAGTIINIPVAEYLQRSKTFKHCTHGYRSAVTFPHKFNTLSPYFLGLWLGQGNENTHNIVNPEPETTVVLSDLAIAYNLRLIIRKQENGSLNYSINGSSLEDNPVLWHLRNLKVLNNKHIPEEYKANSRDVQLQVLAGLLDSAGKVTRNGYDLMLKDKQLVQDVLFLVRSLGLAAYSWPYLKLDRVTGVTTEHSQVNITGDCSIIPLRVSSKVPKRLPKCKDILSVSITVEPVGIDDYYGFEIDGDRLFLLGDFTVVHNTVIFVRAAKHAGLEGTVLILAHRDRLISQARNKWLEAHPRDRVGIEMADQKTDGTPYDCIVSSVQTLKGARLDRFVAAYKSQVCLIITDECHHATNTSYTNIFEGFRCLPVDSQTGLRPEENRDAPVLLGVTATPKRLDKKLLESIYPYSTYDYPLLDAMREKYLCPVKAYRVETNVDLRGIKQQSGEFNQKELSDKIDVKDRIDLVIKNWKRLGGMTRRNADFCSSKAQCASHAAEYLKHTPNVCVITEEVRGEERERLLETFSWGPLPQVVISVDVMTEGTDIAQLDMITNSAPTKSAGRFMQRIGRGLRNYEGSKNPYAAEYESWPRTLPRKEHLLFLDIVDTVRSQSDIMTVPRILGLPANFDLDGDDLLEAKNMMDEVLERNPALVSALETMAETDEKMPKTFAELKTQLQRIMLFAPNNPRGLAKEYSKLAWLAADERAIMENDADNSHVYVLQVPAPKVPVGNEVATQRFVRLEYRPVAGFWYVVLQGRNPESIALEREAAYNINQSKRFDIPKQYKGQFYSKARAANQAASLIPLITLKENQLYPDLEQSICHVDSYVKKRHPSAMPLINLEASWRKRSATPPQLALAKRLQIPIHPAMKAGDVSDLINNYKNLKPVEDL